MSLVTYANSSMSFFSMSLGTQSHILFSTHDLPCTTDLTRIGNASSRLFQDQQGRICLQEKTIAEVVGERILRPLIDRTSSILFKLYSLAGKFPSILPSLPGAQAEEIILSSSSTCIKETINLDQPIVNLEEIRDTKGDINEIRLLLKGSVETCNNLFRKAVEEGDVILQIQLSHALFGIKQGKDDAKDFSSLSAGDLETFSYYPREFTLFNSAYDQAMGVKSDWNTHYARGEETFRLAANQGYLPAFLALKSKEWGWYTDKSSYGFAAELRPFVGKGDRQLDYHFGQALKNGCQVGSELYYEGMYWMNQSGNIQVKYPREHECFEDFTRRYIRYEDCRNTYYNHDGFLHVGSVVLAPSKEAWETFVKEKLSDIRVSPVESYVFEYDAAQLKSLLNEHKIGAVHTGSFVKSTTEGRDIESFRGGAAHGFRIDSLSIYQDHERIGEISVQEDTFKIHQTFKNQKIQPIIDFIENIMTRTGSAGSARSWLRQMGGRYI